MSEELDKKVVEMRFDCKDFSKDVQSSMDSIESLKKSLDFGNVGESFRAIERAAKSTDISALSLAADEVGVRFNTMQIAAVTAISNIVNSAMDAGKKLIASLSVDNISDGWQKFGDKTISVGTLVAQGYDINTVTKQLDRLNWFTDETSYNFTAMVENISKFTAAGKGLKDSVTAMEGIANWAALSGQSASTASRAMYQLSQAMGAGVMRLEDYKSIQNVSMDTDEFRQKALDAAVALGTLKKNADGTYVSLVAAEKAGREAFTKSQFANNLTQGKWFTSDVMMKVFGDYSKAVDDIYDYAIERGITASEAIEELGNKVDTFGLKAFRAAQEARTWADVIDSVKDAVSTGWMTTAENIFGNYEEAKELWTDLANELYDVFAEGGNVRNELLGEWKQLGGRNVLIESFWDVYYSLIDVVNAVKEAFHDIFPEITVKRIVEITKSIRMMTAKLIPTQNELTTLKKIVSGLFSVLDMGIKTVKALASGFEPVLVYIENLANDSDNAAIKLGNFLTNMDDAAERMGVFETISRRTANVVNIFIGYLDRLVDNNISDYMLGFAKSGNAATGVLYALAGNIGNAVRMIFDLLSAVTGRDLSGVRDRVLTVVANVQQLLVRLFDKIINTVKNGYDVIKNFSFGDLLVGMFSTSDSEGSVGGIQNVFTTIGNSISNGFKNIEQIFTESEKTVSVVDGKTNGIISKFTSTLGKFEPLKPLGEALKPVANAIGNFLRGFAENISKSFPSWEVVSKFIDTGVTIASVYALVNLAKAIGDFGKTINKIAKGQIIKDILGIEDIIKSVKGVFDQAKDVLEAYQKKIEMSTYQTIATSILIMCASLYVLSTIPIDDLTKAIIGLGAVFAALMILFKQLTKFTDTVLALGNKKKIAAATSFVGAAGLAILEIGASLLLVGGAVALLGRMSADEIAIGLGAMVGILLTMVGVIKAMQLIGPNLSGLRNAKQLPAATASMILIAVAVDAMVPALAILSKLDQNGLDNAWDTIAHIIGFMTMYVVAVGGLSIGNYVSPIQNAGQIVAAASSMIIMALAVDALIPAIAVFTTLGLNTKAAVGGISSFIVVLAAMVTAIEFMAHLKGGVTNPGKIVAVTSSMIIMALAVNALIPAMIAFSAMGVKGLGAAAEIAVMVAGMAFAMSYFDAFDTSAMLKGAAAILIFSIALDALVPAIASLAMANQLLGTGSIATAMVELALSLAAFMGVFELFNLMNKGNIINTVDYVAAAGGILLMAVALNALVPAITAMALLNEKSDLKNIGLAMGELLAVAAIMSMVIGNGGKDAALGGVGLLAAAAAISVLVPALIALGGASLSLMAIGPALAAFGAFAAVISKLGPGLLTATPGMLAMAAALAALAFAMQAMGPAMVILGSGMAAVVAGVVAGTEVLAKHMDSFVESLRIVVEGVVELIIDAVLAIILGVLKAINNYAYDILYEVVAITISILQALVDMIPPFIKVIVDIIDAIIIALGDAAKPILQAIVDFVIALIYALADTLVAPENVEKLKGAIEYLLTNMLASVLTIFGLDIETAKEAAHLCVSEVGGILSGMYKGWYDATEQWGRDLHDKLGIKGANIFESKAIDQRQSEADQRLAQAQAELRLAGAEAERDSDKNFHDDLESAKDHAKELASVSKEMGRETIDSWESAIEEGSSEVQQASVNVAQASANAAADEIDEGYTTAGEKINDATEETVDKANETYDDGLKKSADSADSHFGSIADSAVNLKNNLSASFGEIGGIIASALGLDGFTQGVNGDLSGLSFFRNYDDTFKSAADYEKEKENARIEYAKKIADVEKSIAEAEQKYREAGLSDEEIKAKTEGLRKSIEILKNELEETLEVIERAYKRSNVYDSKLREYEHSLSMLNSEINRAKAVYGPYSDEVANLTEQYTQLNTEYEEYKKKLEGGEWTPLVTDEDGEEDGNNYVDGFTGALSSDKTKKKVKEAFMASFKMPADFGDKPFFKQFSSWDDYVKAGQTPGGFDNVAKEAWENFFDPKASAFETWEKVALEAEMSAAFEAIDSLYAEFKDNTISAGEFWTRYTNILKKGANIQADVIDHLHKTMVSYVQDDLEKVADKFTKTVEEIQSKIDDFADNASAKWADIFTFTMSNIEEQRQNYIDNMTTSLDTLFSAAAESFDQEEQNARSFSEKVSGTLGESITFKTNKDIYDEDVAEYDKNIDNLTEKRDKLNEELERSNELYGENSAISRRLARDIDNLDKQIDKETKARDKYKKDYEDSGKKDDDIAEVNLSETLDEETKDIEKYTEKIKKLRQKGVTPEIMQMIASMDKKEGEALVDELLKMSDEAWSEYISKWNDKVAASDVLGQEISEGSGKTVRDWLDAERTDLSEYEEELKYFTDNYYDEDLYKFISSKPREEGLKILRQLNNMSAAELEQFMKDWRDTVKREKKLGTTLFGNAEDDISVEMSLANVNKVASDNREWSKVYKKFMKLYGETADESFMEYLASLSTNEQRVLMEGIMEKGDRYFATINKTFKDARETAEQNAKDFYSDDLKKAEEDFVNESGEILAKLPAEARRAGAEAVTEIAKGWDSEVTNTLSQIDTSIETIAEHIRKKFEETDFGLGDNESMFSTLFISQLMDSVPNWLSSALAAVDYAQTSDNALNNASNISNTVSSASRSSKPTVSVVIDDVSISKMRSAWYDPSSRKDTFVDSSLSGQLADSISSNEIGIGESLDRIETELIKTNTILGRTEALVGNVRADVTSGLNGLGESFSNAQVVIDANAAAAKLALPINNIIGRMAIHKIRGG